MTLYMGLPQWLITIALQHYFQHRHMHFCDFKDFNLLTRVCHLQSHICPWLDPPSKLKQAPQVITSARFTSEWFLTRVTPTEQNNICIVRTGQYLCIVCIAVNEQIASKSCETRVRLRNTMLCDQCNKLGWFTMRSSR